MKNNNFKKLLSIFFCLTLIASIFAVPASAEDPIITNTSPQIKNVIFMVPDGGGYGQYDYANEVMKKYGGINLSKFPNATHYSAEEAANGLYLRNYLIGSRKNLSYNGGIIDSAASSTALQTGILPPNSYVGIDDMKKPLATLLEGAMYMGKSTGLITNEFWWGATPASAAAHATNRYNYYEITHQILNKGVDVVLMANLNLLDGRNSEYNVGITQQDALDRGYRQLTSKADLANVQPGDKIWGQQGREWGGNFQTNLSNGEGRLSEYLEATIKALEGNEDGFFILCEMSHTDNHGHDGSNAVSEYIAFDEAFKVAVEYAKGRTDTMVIATPDHDTGGLYGPYSGVSFTNKEIEDGYNGLDSSTLTWTGNGNHTTMNVPVWLYVPEGITTSSNITKANWNNPGDTPQTRANDALVITDLAPFVSEQMGINLNALTEELFVDITDYGIYFHDEDKFVFANNENGEKSVTMYDTKYYVDGVEHDMGHWEAFMIEDRIYVPSMMVEAEDFNHLGEKLNGIRGSGTQNDPYLIKDVYDFIEFGNNLEAGETYDGMYFEQTADLNLAEYTDEFDGISSTATFGGIYDAKAHTININLTSRNGSGLFPRVTGTILNLGTTGTLNLAGNQAGGIARTLAPSGKILNCYSTLDITAKQAGGIVYNQYGKIINSFFAGTMNANSYNAIGLTRSRGSYSNSYYKNVYPQRAAAGVRAMADSTMKSTLANTLNDYRVNAAALADVEERLIAFWTQENGSLPTLYIGTPTVTDIIVTDEHGNTEITVAKGSSVPLYAEVVGDYYPSQEVLWSLNPESECGSSIDEHGTLTISADETVTRFTVMAKSKQDSTQTGSLTVIVE